MIEGMLKKEKRTRGRRSKKETWFLYLLKCADGSLYTGITNDLDRRLQMHQNGKASRYTRARRPVNMVYHEKCKSRARALVRECMVKTFSKKKKLELAETR